MGKQLDQSVTADSLPQRLFQRGYSLMRRGVSEVFTPEYKANLQDMLDTSAREVIESSKASCSNVYDQYLWPDTYLYARYPSFLFELCLRPYMTERSIVLSNEILDMHLKIPLSVRANDKLWLAVLKRLNRDIATVRNANTGYSPYMSPLAISALDMAKDFAPRLPFYWRLHKKFAGSGSEAPKSGLSPHSWSRFDWMIRNNKALREIVIDTFNDDDALPKEIFDVDTVRKLVAEHLADKGHHRDVIFALLTFGRWHQRYGVH